MKIKHISLILCVLMIIGMMFSAAVAEEHPAHLTIVATNYPLYDMVCQIGGGHLNAFYQPEANADSIEGADILLCMGGEKEAWANELEGVTVIRAMEGAKIIEGEENILTIPVNNMLAACALIDTLTVLDEAHSQMYNDNFDAYMDALIELDQEFCQAVSEETKVSCEDGSMAYFADEYGVEIADSADSIALKTYENPADEDLTVPYIELMHRNLEALK